MDLRILADDLTGALDTAAAFDGEVPVFFDRPGDAAGAPVSVVATGSRDVDPGALPALLAPALEWLAGAGAGSGGLAFKKVDSLLRGNTVAELRLAAQTGAFERLIVAPAFPAQGRWTVAGRLRRADGVPGPDGPSLPEALANLDLPVEVPDVRTDADLQRLAERAATAEARRCLWVGSAGLAQALARRLGVPARPPAAPTGAGRRPLLLVSASHQAVSRRQWARLLPAFPRACLARWGDEAALRSALLALGSRPGHAPADVALLDLAPHDPLNAATAAALRDRLLGMIAHTAPPPGVLAVVGGDTLLGLCRATGARGLRAMPALRGGWGQARWIGGAWDGVPCHSRSGAFGDDDDLLEAVRALAGS